MDSLDIGKIIKQGRIEKNISQKELSDEFGITPGAISAWETNKTTPPAHTLIAIAKKLNIVDELFGKSKVVVNQDEEIKKIWHEISQIKEKLNSLSCTCTKHDV